jgi:hypothetical protein
MDPMMSHSKKTLVKRTFGDCGRNGRIHSYMNGRKKETKTKKKERKKEKRKKENRHAAIAKSLNVQK